MHRDTLAKVLRVERAKRHLHLRQVQEATGVSRALISELERGAAADPRMSSVEKLLGFYGLELTVAGDGQQTP